MARRRKRDERIEAAAQLIGLLALLSLISPQVRQTISAIGLLAICVMALAVAALIGFGVYGLAIRSRQSQPIEQNVDCGALSVTTTVEEKQPKTIPELIEQLRSIDWFQFEKAVALVYRKLG